MQCIFHLQYISLIGAVSGVESEYQLPYGLIDVNCTGTEGSIWDCPYNGSNASCPIGNDGGVICQSKEV